jgi:predicted ribosome quality control (RQC) complex YloA/Tae2 family protein
MVKKDSTFPNNLIRIGENDRDNDKIISESKQTDVWFHLDKLPSTHIIISVDKDNPITKEMIDHCASLTKQHTKYRNVPIVKVIYTDIKNVEMLDKPGLVHIRGKKKAETVNVKTVKNEDGTNSYIVN